MAGRPALTELRFEPAAGAHAEASILLLGAPPIARPPADLMARLTSAYRTITASAGGSPSAATGTPDHPRHGRRVLFVSEIDNQHQKRLPSGR